MQPDLEVVKDWLRLGLPYIDAPVGWRSTRLFLDYVKLREAPDCFGIIRAPRCVVQPYQMTPKAGSSSWVPQSYRRVRNDVRDIRDVFAGSAREKVEATYCIANGKAQGGTIELLILRKN